MFTLSDDQRALQEAARAAAQSILSGSLKEDDEAERFRKDHFEALGEAGLCGIPTAERFGGLGLG